MKRERATTLLKELLQNATSEDWPAGLIQSVHVFGSYLRGALEPGDVDVAVDIEYRNDRWVHHHLASMIEGRDPYSLIRLALRGRRRSISILFERNHGHDDVPMKLLWMRGEDLNVAMERVDEIPEDATAGRAPRHAMLPCFAGLDKRLPRHLREELVSLIKDDIITIEQVILEDDHLTDPWICEQINDRWKMKSPLRRAAHAALTHLESRGVDIYKVHLHGRDLAEKVTPHFVSFGLKYLSNALHCFKKWDGIEWLEVVHPTQSSPLVALRIRPHDRDRLNNREWQPGSFFS